MLSHCLSFAIKSNKCTIQNSTFQYCHNATLHLGMSHVLVRFQKTGLCMLILLVGLVNFGFLGIQILFYFLFLMICVILEKF